MNFFGNSPLVVYIRKNSIDFYQDNDVKGLEFSESIIKHLEVIDSEKYKKHLLEFLSIAHIKKQKVLILLSDEILFQKIILSTQKESFSKIAQDFLEMVPIPREKLSKKYVQLNKEIYLFATNKEIFKICLEVLEEAELTVLSVNPLSLFIQDQDLNKSVIKRLYSKKDIIKKSDFLRDTLYIEDNINTSHSNSKVIYVVFLLLLLILAAAIFGAIKYFNILDPEKKKEIKPVVTEASSSALVSTPSATTEVSSSSAEIKKEDLIIQIFNGTGVAGQASIIKEELLKHGFSKIETGDAQGANSEESVAVFSAKVSSSLQSEIVKILEESFTKVTTQQFAASASADILITTGKTK